MELQSNLISVHKWLIIANFIFILVLIYFAIKNYFRWHNRVKLSTKYQTISDKTNEVNTGLKKKNALLEKQNKDLKETSNYLKDNAHNIGMQIAIEMFACKDVPELDSYLVSLTEKPLEQYHPLAHYKTLKVLEYNLPNLDKEKLIENHADMSSLQEEQIRINEMEVKDAIFEENQDYSDELKEYKKTQSDELSEQDLADASKEISETLKDSNSVEFPFQKAVMKQKLCSCMKPNPNPSNICQNCMNPVK